MKPFFTILTLYGKTALAEALAAQAPLEVPYMAVGDGGGAYYEPSENQTNLRNEKWRGDLNDLRAEDNIQGQVIAEAIIPHDIDGDWTAREVGLFDAKGGLIAVGKYPETYIPPAHSGAKSQAYINIIIQVDNVAAVSLTTNHDVVIASKAFVENLSLQQEIAFNNALTSNVYPVTNVVQSSGMNNSLVHALKNTVSIHKMYAMAKGGSVYVGVQMGDKTYPSAIEYKFDVNEDNLLLLRGVRGGLLSDSSNALRFNKPLFVDSTANINSAPNCYMTEIGSKITGQFFGNRFIFRGYKDNRGGMWKITLTSDTGMIYRKDLSTYKETAVTATGIEEDVFGKLPNATYQYELVFTGSDPKNPPASGQARGWFTYKPNDSQYQPVVTYDSMPLDESTAKWLSAPNSIIDFALSVKPNNSSFSARWVPVHGGVMGVSDRLNRKAYLDGIVIVDETTVKDFPLIEIESFRIDQMFFAKHPESPERLWTHFVSHTIKNGELSIENKLDFTSDTFVSASYLNMTAVVTSSMTRFLTNTGTEVSPIKHDGSTDLYNFAPSSILYAGWYNQQKGLSHGVATDAELFTSCNLFTNLQNKNLFRQHWRADGDITKTYWQAMMQNIVIPKGVTIRGKTTHFFVTGVRSPNNELRFI